MFEFESECRSVLSGLERQALATYLLLTAGNERPVVRKRYAKKTGSLNAFIFKLFRVRRSNPSPKRLMFFAHDRQQSTQSGPP